MSLPPLLHTDIIKLQSSINLFGSGKAEEKQALLAVFSEQPIKSIAVLKAYHDALLFLKAYPDNKKIRHFAETALERLAECTRSIMQGSDYKAKLYLSGTGMAGSLLTGQYSFTIAKWLVKKFTGAVFLHSVAGDAIAGADILHRVFPGIEYYFTTQEKMPLQKRVLLLAGDNEPINNLLLAFEQHIEDEKLRETLYDQLKIFISWQLDNNSFNRSFISGIGRPFYYHNKLIKQVNITAVFAMPCPESEKLTGPQQTQLLDAARASLAFYYRETEPITQAAPNQVQLFNCGRGIYIALYGMKPQRRLTIESYIGYMVFKNNVPVAYGGGWMFGDRCKIGLNIYPPFRKGESAVIFSQVLRLYHLFFNQQRFVIKPYQYGKGNREGLKSGAFWFYYKLGFRPVDEKIALVAATEWKEKRQSSPTLLKLFTACNMEMVINPLLPNDLEPEQISKRITQVINTKYNGNRQWAIAGASRFLQKELRADADAFEKSHMNQFALMLALLIDLPKWKSREKTQLSKIIKAKIRSEAQYIRLVQQCPELIKELYHVTIGTPAR